MPYCLDCYTYCSKNVSGVVTQTVKWTFHIQVTCRTSLSFQCHTWNARVFMAMTAFKGISMIMTATPARTDGPRFCGTQRMVNSLIHIRVTDRVSVSMEDVVAVQTYLPEEIQSQNDLKWSRPQHVEEGGQIHEPLGIHGHEVHYLSHCGWALGSICYHQCLWRNKTTLMKAFLFSI